MKRVQFSFYNLAPAGDPDRGPAFVARESEAIVNDRPRNPLRRRPKVFGVVEAIGRQLPELKHYDLVRDTSNSSRANVALYVRRDLGQGKPQWIQHEQTWKRPLHPGFHEPRATLVVPVENWTVVVAHAPQVGKPMGAAREEWLGILAGVLCRTGPVLLLSDPNALGHDLVVRVPGASVEGTTIEAAHARGAILRGVRTPAEIRGVPMLSDHKKCLLGTAVRK